jgi:transcription antitermination factor NusG
VLKHNFVQDAASEAQLTIAETPDGAEGPRWFALFTLPQHERAVAKRLDNMNIESFLPTYEVKRTWKNRQHATIMMPVFPTYLFVRLTRIERWRAVNSPGIVRIVGNSRGPIPIADNEIDFLRSDFCRSTIEPFEELPVGSRVRITRGPMSGFEGILVRKRSSVRFVLTLNVINLRAAVEVDVKDLEACPPA